MDCTGKGGNAYRINCWVFLLEKNLLIHNKSLYIYFCILANKLWTLYFYGEYYRVLQISEIHTPPIHICLKKHLPFLQSNIGTVQPSSGIFSVFQIPQPTDGAVYNNFMILITLWGFFSKKNDSQTAYFNYFVTKSLSGNLCEIKFPVIYAWHKNVNFDEWSSLELLMNDYIHL